jgi:hypothetical protein
MASIVALRHPITAASSKLASIIRSKTEAFAFFAFALRLAEVFAVDFLAAMTPSLSAACFHGVTQQIVPPRSTKIKLRDTIS